MKRNSFNVLFFIKKAKLLKNGEASVCMRITVNCARVETNIRKSIDPASWNQAKECVRGKSRKARDLNAYIENAKIKLHHALKEELHGIHGSLKHTVQRERAAFKALEAAKESADNIVDGISNAIVKVEKNTVIHAKVDDSELAKVNQCSANHIKAEKKLLEEHSKKLAKHLQKNEGIWLSSFWTKIMMSFFTFYTILLLIYTYIK